MTRSATTSPRRPTGSRRTSRASATGRSCRTCSRARCARGCRASPPDGAEPFAAVLRDLDELIAPGLTHWNHPRFFAYFANTGSRAGDPRRAADRGAERERDVVGTSPAATELEQVVLDWLAQLLGLPAGLHGHIEDTASTSTLAALAAARALRPGGVVYASEHAHFSVEKAARLLGLELRTVPVDDEFRMLPDFPLDDATAVVATVGHDLVDLGRSGGRARRPLRGRRRLAPRRRGLRRLGGGLPGAPLVPRRRRPRRLDRRQPAQVAVHADGLLDALDAPPRGAAARRSRPTATTSAPTEDALDLRDYGPALGRRFRALKLWTVLRCYGRDGLQALIREHVRLAALLRGVGRRRARLGGLGAAALLDGLLPARARSTTTRSRGGDGDRPRSSSRRRSLAGRERDPARDRQRGHAGGGRPGRLGGAARVRAVIFDLWDTLVEWPVEEAREADRRARRATSASDARSSTRRWQASYRASQTRPLADVYRSLGIPDEHVDGARRRAARVRPPRPAARATAPRRRSATLRRRAAEARR